MSDEKLVIMINLSKLIAVSEYLCERGDEHVCFVLNRIISSLQDVLTNSKQK